MDPRRRLDVPLGAGPARIAFVIPPTGLYCREDRCQSRFRFDLIPTQRAPLEECEAAGAIRAAGGTPFVVDAPAEGLSDAAVLARLAKIRPDLVVLVTTFGSLDFDLGWAKRIRDALPAAKIAARGTPALIHAEAILAEAPDLDFCVQGEYELVFGDLVHAAPDRVAGVILRSAGGGTQGAPAPYARDLDALPRAARDVVDGRRYRVRGLGAPQATVRVQRGCPFPCSYCLVGRVSGSEARHRSPKSIAEELADLCAEGTRHFYLRADTFSLDRAWALETSRAIGRLAPEARWVTTTRVECVDDALVAAMADGGCYGLSFGIDVGSREIGERVGKRPDLTRADRAMRACDRAGVLSLGYFMIGFLWDTPGTIAETTRFAREVRPDLLTIHFAHPYPGTRYHAQVRAAGRRIESVEAQSTPAFATGGLSREALERAAREMLFRHYLDPRVVASIARKSARLAVDRSWRAVARSFARSRVGRPSIAAGVEAPRASR
ncbi:MAG: radical SAM protein [Myxococcota bacterium]